MKKESYQLKNAETGFFDDETGLDVTRDQVVQIGDGAGKKTLAMIRSGGLIKVGLAAQPPSGFDPNAGSNTPLNPPAGASDALADDFPGREALSAASIITGAGVDALSDEDLGKITNIGPKTVEQIRAARKSSKKA